MLVRTVVAAAAEKFSHGINFCALRSTAKFRSANTYRSTKVTCTRQIFVRQNLPAIQYNPADKIMMCILHSR